ncbi:hypothetical protein MKW94_000077 [Papaver nudicaule]|uniref:Large ribosomal subunit protein mL53 n=1 Tax=Papaver nudicaule TaxID=74823 RepID=A0AA41VF21_PAPNU|nr:hypothetical protein [Papaver nudicaule]
MLKFLLKVRIEFNALDQRTTACMEFLAQCNVRKAKESNRGCQLEVKPRTYCSTSSYYLDATEK